MISKTKCNERINETAARLIRAIQLPIDKMLILIDLIGHPFFHSPLVYLMSLTLVFLSRV